MNRRNFVKFSAGSLLATPLLANALPAIYTDKYASKIVSVFDQNASSIAYTEGSKLNSDNVIVDKITKWKMDNLRIARMVNEAVMGITDQPTIGKAWESLFPAGHPNADTKIGVKLNFSFGDWRGDEDNKWSEMYCPFGPKSAVTNAIIAGLTQMLDGTFPVENITFIERMYSVGMRKYFPVVQGYRPVFENDDGLFIDKQAGAPGQHWIYATNPLELPDDSPSFIAAPDYPEKYQAPQRIYAAYYKQDFLINYAIGKDHRAAGITGVMKNNYGCTDNPVGTHGTGEWRTDNSPFAGTRLCVPMFYKNVNHHSPYVLNIMDALSIVYTGGPLSGKVEHANTIAVSKDPVALDSYLLDMINQARSKHGLTTLATSAGRTSDGHPNASFLSVSAEKHELGSMSLKNVKKIDLSADSRPVLLPEQENSQSLLGNVVKTQNGYSVNVLMDNSNREHVIESKILNMRGRIVKEHATQKTRSSLQTLEWNHNNNEGVAMKDGVYIWMINVDGRLHNCTINDFYTT